MQAKVKGVLEHCLQIVARLVVSRAYNKSAQAKL